MYLRSEKIMRNLILPLLFAMLLVSSGAQGADTFSTYRVGLTSPIMNAFAVTPHDTNALTNDSRAIYIGSGGNIVLVTTGGDTITLVGVLGGTIYSIRANIIKSTGTTATNIVALY